MPIDILDGLDDLLNGGDDGDTVMCPTCLGAGYVEDPYGPCPRCDRAMKVPRDSLTADEERALLYAELDNDLSGWDTTQAAEGWGDTDEDNAVNPEELDDPTGFLDDEDTDHDNGPYTDGDTPGVSS